MKKLVDGLKQLVNFFASGIGRIFSPTDDNYPANGVQPFEGNLRRRKRHRWSW